MMTRTDTPQQQFLGFGSKGADIQEARMNTRTWTHLHARTLIQAIFLHIHYLSSVPIHAPRMLPIRMLGLKFIK
jgi:hypothetical protein